MKKLTFLFLLAASTLACHKPQNGPKKNTSLAARIAGTRHWTNGKYHFQIASVPTEAGIRDAALNDTSFAITFVNDTTIRVWGSQLDFNISGVDSFFSDSYQLSIRTTTDSIFFRYFHHFSAAANEYTTYSTARY